MKVRNINFSKRHIAVAAGVSLFVVTGTTLALNNPAPTNADEKPPIIQQVENHEERIGDLETKTDATQTQVNQNSADIKNVQTHTGSPKAATVAPVQTPVAQPAPSQPAAPTPAPQPVIDPYTIVSMTDLPTNTGHDCTYVVQNGYQKLVHTGRQVECFAIGTLLPQWLR